VSKEELNETMVLKTDGEHHRTEKGVTLPVPNTTYCHPFLSLFIPVMDL
jgi:hypothetical protein